MILTDLRQVLSDELHARSFYDFNSARQFIRSVFRINNDAHVFLECVNAFLQGHASSPIAPNSKFARVAFDE